MAAILGLDDAMCAMSARKRRTDEVLEAANLNAPAQIVIAGQRERLSAEPKREGARCEAWRDAAHERAVALQPHAPCGGQARGIPRAGSRFPAAVPVIHNADVAVIRAGCDK